MKKILGTSKAFDMAVAAGDKTAQYTIDRFTGEGKLPKVILDNVSLDPLAAQPDISMTQVMLRRRDNISLHDMQRQAFKAQATKIVKTVVEQCPYCNHEVHFRTVSGQMRGIYAVPNEIKDFNKQEHIVIRNFFHEEVRRGYPIMLEETVYDPSGYDLKYYYNLRGVTLLGHRYENNGYRDIQNDTEYTVAEIHDIVDGKVPGMRVVQVLGAELHPGLRSYLGRR